MSPPLQLRYSTCYSSVTAALHLRYSFVTASARAPLPLRCTSATPPLQLPLQFRCSSVTVPLQLRYCSDAPPLQLPCTSVAAPLQLPLQHLLQFRYSSVIQLRYSSVAVPLRLRDSSRYSSVVQLRYSSFACPLQVRYKSVIKLLLLPRLRSSFRCSIATAGSVPLQPSDPAPLQLRDKSVTAPLLSVTVSVISPVTGEHFCNSRGLQMMVEPRPNSKDLMQKPLYERLM